MPSNLERAARLVRALETGIQGDSSLIAELFTDDVKGWSPAFAISSSAELAVEIEDRDQAFSDVVLDVSPLDVSGERACVEWSATMTHSGPLALVNDVVIEPTGLRVTLYGVTVAEFDGDRIRSFRQYWDEATLLEQLGGLPDADT